VNAYKDDFIWKGDNSVGLGNKILVIRIGRGAQVSGMQEQGNGMWSQGVGKGNKVMECGHKE
jgi:hypothetical protein